MSQVVVPQLPPVLLGPSDKEKKYDRQLRLWAPQGQAALEDAHILLLNSGAGTVGVETLKNLVLPGIGKFTITDDATVTEADLGVNFFLDEDCLGKSRAESCARLLNELNTDVKSDWYPKNSGESIKDLLADDRKYTLIIYTLPISPDNLALVHYYCGQHQVPLLSIHSAGFYSYFRIHLPGTFPIVDTHPDTSATTDLRLLNAWTELTSFSKTLTKNLDSLSDHEHGHIPYVALLLHYLEEYEAKNGKYPQAYKEKVAFRGIVASGARMDTPEGGEENFEEAAAAVLKTIAPQTLPSSVQEVFAYQPNAIELKSDFWIIANAVKNFHSKHGQLPLPGSVPDMKAQSDVYVQLQNIYKAKARQDVSEVLEYVRASPGGDKVNTAEVDTFCKNAAFIKLVHQRIPAPASIQELAKQEVENDENAALTAMPLSLLPIYLALKATSHAPSAPATEILTSMGECIPEATTNSRFVQIAEEVARAWGGELHNTSALTGGMVAQEIIKIITKQYIPVDNICVFDGIASRTQVFRV